MATASAVKIQNGYKISGIAPPDLAAHDDSTRKLFWGWVVELGLKRKDKELSQGLDKDGKPLKAISAYTRSHRRSAMTPSGKGDPSAPPLMPAWQKSRTRSLLAGRAFTTHAAFFWKYDAWTGASWAEVLSFQAAKGRDVFGLSPAGMAWVKAQSWARWKQWQAGRLRMPVPGSIRQASAAQFGNQNFEHIDHGVSASGSGSTPASFLPGTFSGWSTPEQRRKYFSQTASATLPGRSARPKSKSPIVGPEYNRLLQHVWGTQTFPGRGGSGAAPPKPKPPAKPKTPKPAPSPAAPQAPTWSPTMTAKQAEAWSKGSVIRDELTHVTTEAAASSIEKGGFRLDLAEKMGRIWGNGTYLGIGHESAEHYKEWTKNPRALKIRVNVQKVLDFDASKSNPTASQAVYTLIQQLGKEDEFDRLLEQSEKRGDPGDKLDRSRKILMSILKAEGYDAVRITQGTFTTNVGGNQLIVLDPKRIVVIRD